MDRRTESLILKRLKQRGRQGSRASRSVIDSIRAYTSLVRAAPIEVGRLAEGYDVIINDESVINPFIASSYLVNVARSVTQGKPSLEDRAFSLYRWVEGNITYSRKPESYRNSKETLDERRGICGEMAFLYITMARSMGLRSAYVSVTRDNAGKDVSHGCAITDLGHRDILVDPAYHAFDIRHQEYQVRTDAEVLQMFNQWRRT